jgi:hypothetical protein
MDPHAPAGHEEARRVADVSLAERAGDEDDGLGPNINFPDAEVDDDDDDDEVLQPRKPWRSSAWIMPRWPALPKKKS